MLAAHFVLFFFQVVNRCIRCITVTSSLYLQTSGSHIDPVVPPQVTEAPHSLTNGTHAVSSFPQPPLIHSGAAKPAASGNVKPSFHYENKLA